MIEAYQILWNIANNPTLTYWIGWAVGIICGFWIGKHAHCKEKRP